MTWGWALKRLALGIAILTLAVSALAWLTYASIDPEVESGASAPADQPLVTKTSIRF
jgi:hypothetical protein